MSIRPVLVMVGRRFRPRVPMATLMIVSVLVPGVALASSSPAGAASNVLPKKYAKFAHCPVDKKAVTACVYSVLNSGTFQAGSASLAVTTPYTVSLGLIPNKDGTLTAVAPDDGTPVMQGAPIPVSILGLPGLPSPLNVTATPNLVALPVIHFGNILSGNGPGLSLPVDVSINSILIGPGCSIGNSSNPIVLNLTTGTTSPPAPNQPITGSLGKGSIDSKGVITFTGMKLVDNAFAVPGAYGCGPLGILDEALDLAEGLPSAAGHNTGIFNATASFAPATVIRSYL